jgi:hypothetical protein
MWAKRNKSQYCGTGMNVVMSPQAHNVFNFTFPVSSLDNFVKILLAPVSMFAVVSSLPSVSLSGNPWKRSARLDDFHTILSSPWDSQIVSPSKAVAATIRTAE